MTAQPKTTSQQVAVPARVHIVLIAVQLGFGSMHVVAKGVLDHLHPLALAVFRIVGAAPLLLFIAWLIERRLPKGKDYLYLALLGFFGVFANQLLFIYGLHLTTATNAGILMPSIPVLAAAIGVLFRIEKLTWEKAGGIAMAVVGSMVMLNLGSLSFEGGRAWGNLMILTNCASFACFLVLQKPILERLGPITVTAWSYVFGGAGIIAVGAIGMPAMNPAAIPPWVWVGVIYIVVVPASICYSANAWAVRQSSPTLAATYITLQPVVSATLAAIFLAESMGLKEAAGFLFIIGGLALVSRPRKPDADSSQ